MIERVAGGLLVLALLAGPYLLPAPPADGAIHAALHVHTRLSDGLLSPMEVVEVARRRGVEVLAVTEHNSTAAARIAEAWSRWTDGPVVLVGEEITTRDYHLLAYGLSRTVEPRRDLRTVLDEVHRQGAVAVAAHPARRYWAAFEGHVDALDGVEVVHPMAFLPDRPGFRWSDMVAFHERHPELTPVGTSDYHGFDGFDALVTRLEVDRWPDDRAGRCAASLEALRAGRTSTHAPDGRLFGLPAAPRQLPPRSWPGRFLAAVGLLSWLLLLTVRSRHEGRA